MPDPEQSAAKPAAWWGRIYALAGEHATTAKIWEGIRSFAAEQGLGIPSNMFSEVNRIRGLASGLVSAGDRLARAADSYVLTSREIGTEIYARGAAAMEANPLYHVRFEMTSVRGALETTGTYTLLLGRELEGMTAGELRDTVRTFGADLADSYNQSFVDIGRIVIGAW